MKCMAKIIGIRRCGSCLAYIESAFGTKARLKIVSLVNGAPYVRVAARRKNEGNEYENNWHNTTSRGVFAFVL